MKEYELKQMREFFEQDNNAKKSGGNIDDVEHIPGVIVENGKLIGLGIHILNESVYPIEKFELYLRDKNLTGELNLSNCEDMVFLDVYRNNITSVKAYNMPKMRIFGVQDNNLTSLDVTGLPACQGIDAGKNNLSDIDISKNSELVEFYIHYNEFKKIDISHNKKLKYFYCNDNQIEYLDATNNPLLRHLDATNNPMKEIKALAPQREEILPLNVKALEGGYIGLKFNPVYTPQWKETGEWQQSYYAYPIEGYEFEGWYEDDNKVSDEVIWIDNYGSSRELVAKFCKKI